MLEGACDHKMGPIKINKASYTQGRERLESGGDHPIGAPCRDHTVAARGQAQESKPLAVTTP